MDTPAPGWAPATARLRVYRAEDNASRIRPVPPIGELDGTLDGAQRWADKITRSAWWRRTAAPSWRGDNTGHGRTYRGPPRRIICCPTTGRCSYAKHWVNFGARDDWPKWLSELADAFHPERPGVRRGC